jgi:hypothetical protein
MERDIIEDAEDDFIKLSSLLIDTTYEKFITGELNQQEYQDINSLLSKWIDNGKQLMEFVS